MNIKRSTIGLISLILAVISSHARSVSGVVVAESDSTAIAGATCRLFDGIDAVAVATSAADGSFTVSTDLDSALKVEIGLTGYSPTEILIHSGDKNVDLGNVFLSEGVALGEVTVTAATEIDSRGRTIVYPGAAEVKASASSISLFQKLPLAGLEANPINRSMSVDGGSPYILINGVPSTIDDVNSLQPKDIAKIEYSRVTPARYADKGTNGFINIILKKRTDGGQVYLWGRSATATAFMDGNFKASYHQGASQFTLNYNPTWRNYAEVYDNRVESYIGDDFKVDIEEHDRNPFYYHGHQLQLKYDYTPNDATLFSATFRAAPGYSGRRVIGHNFDSELGDYDYRNHTDSKDFSPSLDLFLRRDFNDKNSLEAQIVGTLSSDDYHRENKYIYADATSDEYLVDVEGRRRSIISEISYIHDFSDKTQLSGGFQNTLSRSTNTYLSTGYKPVLTENNNYLYARLGQQIGKVYFSVSTGLKMFWIKNDLNKRNFIRNRTAAQFQWTIDQKWTMSGSFRYGPVIPSLTALTDYPQQVSPYLISNGSPDLKVADSFVYQLTPGFRYKKLSSSLMVRYANTPNAIISDVRYLGGKKFLSQSINTKSSDVFSANINLRLNDIRGFGASVDFGVGRYECSGEGWSDKLTSFEGSFSLWWNNGPFTIAYWRKIPGKYLSGHIERRDENGDALQFEFQPDKHWTFSASWMYMFDVKGTKYPSWGHSETNPFHNERYIKNNGNMVVLSASYSADFGSIFRGGRRSLNNSDNGSSILKL